MSSLTPHINEVVWIVPDLLACCIAVVGGCGPELSKQALFDRSVPFSLLKQFEWCAQKQLCCTAYPIKKMLSSFIYCQCWSIGQSVACFCPLDLQDDCKCALVLFRNYRFLKSLVWPNSVNRIAIFQRWIMNQHWRTSFPLPVLRTLTWYHVLTQ